MARCISFSLFQFSLSCIISTSSTHVPALSVCVCVCAACLLFRHFFFFCLSFCIACTLLRFRFYNFLQFDFFISLGSISICFPPSPSHIPFDLLSISFNLIVQLPISLPPSLSGVSLDGFILSITILARYLCDLSPCGA